MIVTSILNNENTIKNPSPEDGIPVTPSPGDANTILNLPLFEEKRAERHDSYQDVADGTDLSEPTVRRFMHGQSKNPSFWNVYAIATYLGLEWDKVIHRSAKKVPEASPETIQHLKEIIAMKDKQVEDISAQRDRYRDHFKGEIEEVRRLADERLKEKQANMEDQAETIQNQAATINAQSDTISKQSTFIRVFIIIAAVILAIDILFGGAGWIRYEGGLQTVLFG